MATRKIAIRGIILDARYDADWLSSMINKGIFTPESYVRRELDAARAAKDDVEIIVSSQGGSVFSGFEMSNAIRDFAKVGHLELTVGAFAASAAAMIVLDAANAGIAVHAHRNSILLYHGAWSVTEGGSGAHDDTARMLDQINSTIIDGLKARGVPQAMIDEGFGEGRQMTMTAAEALSFGIVTDVADELAERGQKPDAADLETIRENGLDYDIAAWQIDDGSGDAAAPADPSAPADPDSHGGDGGDGALLARIDALQAQLRAVQSGKDRELARISAESKSALDKAMSDCAAAQAEFARYRETAQATINDLTMKLNAALADAETARANHAAIVGALNAPDSGDAGHEPASWIDAIDRFGLAEAIRRFPDLAREYREAHAK